MSDVRVEIIRTPKGRYAWRFAGEDGPPFPGLRRGGIGIKTTAEQRKADDEAVQAGLKFLYEQQQAAAS